MDVPRALAQIAEIHSTLAKADVYRGYRSVPIAASGLVGFGAAWLQPRALATGDPVEFVVYWAIVAFVAGADHCRCAVHFWSLRIILPCTVSVRIKYCTGH